ncbi:sensor histidine kinase [Microvirga yunnanensis]|uniref:sensor histidine kinase n=1 Tax=Microvirga yunnanensis TaxID=2953740 RepID=UPI0021C9A0B1|nr:sensor histidine kinase [Microvirga sp. HBU65207]
MLVQDPLEGAEITGLIDLPIGELLEDGPNCKRTDVGVVVDEKDVHGIGLTENRTGRGASGTGANAEAGPLILSGARHVAGSVPGGRDQGTHPREPSRRGPAPGTLAFLIAALLLLTSAVSLNLFLGRVAENRAFVLRTSSILRNMAELNVVVRAAEAGQRGFILTGERRYLVPYETAIQRLWAEFRDLESAVRDPAQIARLHRLRPLLEGKLAELANTVGLREQGFEAALAVVRTDVGQTLMEDIQAVVDEFEQAEQEIMVSRSQLLEDQARWAARISGLTALLAVAVIVVGVLWLARQRADARVLAAERGFRQDLERQVENRTEELTQVNRELDAFAYTISHDLRAPLRAMHGYADALAEDYAPKLPEEGRRFTSRIMAAAERMEALIQDILTYSRMSREEVRVRPVSLEEAVARVLAHARPRIEETGAVIEVGHPLGTVAAHPAALELVLDNLVANAVKFMAPGETPHIRIRSENRGEWVRLWVEDNGIGIDPSHRERIFEPFHRLHGVETYPGTGIGLAIVRRSLERMGGRCGVDAEAGRGSRFWIELRGAVGEVDQ